MRKPPTSQDVLDLLHNKDILSSIAVEGWVTSTQVIRLMSIVEDLERKASSRNLRGKLLLMCHASYLLAGLVAKVCSPESFVEMLHKLQVPCSELDKAEDILNEITVKLQQGICKEFNETYKDTIKRSLYFIQIAANAFMKLSDEKLMELAKDQTVLPSLSNITDPKIKTDPIIKIEEAALLLNRVHSIQELLKGLEEDGDLKDDRVTIEADYNDLCELMNQIEQDCAIYLGAVRYKQVVSV